MASIYTKNDELWFLDRMLLSPNFLNFLYYFRPIQIIDHHNIIQEIVVFLWKLRVIVFVVDNYQCKIFILELWKAILLEKAVALHNIMKSTSCAIKSTIKLLINLRNDWLDQKSIIPLRTLHIWHYRALKIFQLIFW